MSHSASSACRLDHLVIAATDCAHGVDWFEQASGVRLPVGGRHPLMATHNHLTALSADAFLEIIAIDPSVAAPPDGRTRWFALDDPVRQQRLRQQPRLTTWVLATDDLPAALATVRRFGIDPGVPVLQTRGDLEWQLSLRPDGSLACEGVFPVLIQWPAGVNPVMQMQDQGVRLDRLCLAHPQADRIVSAMHALGLDLSCLPGTLSIEPGEAGLVADLQAGDRTFSLAS